nr:hypothetical protein [Mesorhizobium amorphae]
MLATGEPARAQDGIQLGDVLVDLWLMTRCRAPETVALDIHDKL